MDSRHKKKIIAEGFTILETVVAAAILVFAAVGPMTVAHKTFTAHKEARENIIAHYLAEDALDLIYWRRLRNGMAGVSWLDGFLQCLTDRWCRMEFSAATNVITEPAMAVARTLPGFVYTTSGSIAYNRLFLCNANTTSSGATNPTWLYRHTNTCTPTQFFRYVKMKQDAEQNRVAVAVYVQWISRAGTFGGRVVLTDALTNWRVNPAP